MSEDFIKECEITVYRNSSPKIEMTITHIPTGKRVKGSGLTQYRLKRDLLCELRNRIGRIVDLGELDIKRFPGQEPYKLG